MVCTYTCTFFVLFRAPLQQFTKSTHNPGPQTTTSMYFRRSQSALPEQNDHHHHPHQTYPSQPPQHAPYPSPSSSSPPNPFPSQGEHTSSPVVICHNSDDDDDDSRQGSSALLTTYPPDLGSSYLTTPLQTLASQAHPPPLTHWWMSKSNSHTPHHGMVVTLMTQSGCPSNGSVTRTPYPLTAPADC